MVDVLGIVDIQVPSFAIGVGYLSVILAIFFFVLFGAIIIYFIYDRKVYNRKIIVFENISGQGFQIVLKDRARLIKLGDGGEEILHLKKKKVYRTAYGKKMGKNTYWFAIGQDGYWYNMVLGDIDAKMGMLDIEPIDRDMRYMHVAIRKNITDRYKSKKIATATAIIVSGIVLTMLIMFIGNWFILDKIAEVSKSTSQNIEASAMVQEATKQIVSSLDNICGGSGISPAG